MGIEKKALEKACEKTNRVLKALEKLDELSNYKYDYTEEYIEQIFEEINRRLKTVKSSFRRSLLTKEILDEVENACFDEDEENEMGIKFSNTDSLDNLILKLNLIGQSYIRINDTIVAVFMNDCVILYSEGRFYTEKDASGLFNHSYFTTIDMKGVDTSLTKNMAFMFRGCNASEIDVSEFDTSSVTNMKGMFSSCEASSLDLRSFDTRKVKDMSFMFQHFKGKTIDLGSFDTSNVEDMESMFESNMAESLDLEHFKFRRVKNMFYCCQACITGNIKINNGFMKALAETLG